ncbi:hypothetical protein [Methylocystis echinoides]|uniref:Uncharacterized protein n=1 Tax=Methylocystis echinoides TaxID=29468 RepID=A0A9W6LTI6_9HYPH|nr:hypothetical protein [Methylocystis echinoides]GLI94673.1 hypothetical protein LMG27198_36650 [Methylocystis echinoides]
MTDSSTPATPRLGIFWFVEHPRGHIHLISASCPLDQAEHYGDNMTFSPGHWELWEQWKKDVKASPALRAIVNLFEYEAWPRGRIVFNEPRDRFILYADRKLLTPHFISQIQVRFNLPADRLETSTDDHYRSTESPCIAREGGA